MPRMLDFDSKRCFACKEVKATSEFYVSKARADGLQSQCKDCFRKRDKAKTAEYSHTAYLRHREAYYKRHVAWFKAHPERLREYSKTWYERHKDKSKANYDKWRKDNPHKAIARHHRRRSRQMNAEGHFTAAEWNLLVVLFDHRCAYCWEKPEVLSVDHVIPLVKGGTNWIENILPACRRCNSKKRDRLDWEGLKCLVC